MQLRGGVGYPKAHAFPELTSARADNDFIRNTLIRNALMASLPRILFVCLHSPFANHGGAEQRTSLLFEALRKIGHVDLVCFSDDPPPGSLSGNNYEIKYWYHQNNGGRKPSKILVNKLKFWSPYSVHEIHPTGADVVRDLLDGTTYNHIVLRYVDAAFRCGLYHRKDLIVDVDDDPAEKFRSFFMNAGANLRIRMYYLLCYLLTRLHTKRFMHQASHLFLSNSEQATYPNSSYLPNIPFTKNLPGPEAHFNPDSQVILFVGTMSYEPNWIGMNWFISRVWKQVRKNFPGAELRIVGKGVPPGLAKKWRATPGVQLPGYVKDLQAEYDRASLVIAPIFQGAGTNIKVLEAMAARRCCVMTPFAARGLQDVLTHSENVFIAGDHNGFFNIISELFENPQLNNQVRKNAGVTIQKYFSKDVFFGKINTVFNNLA